MYVKLEVYGVVVVDSIMIQVLNCMKVCFLYVDCINSAIAEIMTYWLTGTNVIMLNTEDIFILTLF